MHLLGEARYAANIALQAHLTPPDRNARIRRFLWGFALPFGIVRASLRIPAVRSHWLRWASVQLAILVMVGVRIGIWRSDFDDAGIRPTFAQIVGLVTETYVALCVVEWILIALARDFHDALSQMAAGATGVIGEPLEGTPRVRLDFKWLWLKAKRKIRAGWLFVVALPLFALTLKIPVAGDVIYLVLTTLWGAYWLAVFAVGGSFLAWEGPPASEHPWYVRSLAHAGRVPLLGIPPRLYARFLGWATRSVLPVCAVIEKDPWASFGLAFSRAICGIPGVYLFLRPAFSVAATHILLVLRQPCDEMPPRAPLPPPPPPHLETR